MLRIATWLANNILASGPKVGRKGGRKGKEGEEEGVEGGSGEVERLFKAWAWSHYSKEII